MDQSNSVLSSSGVFALTVDQDVRDPHARDFSPWRESHRYEKRIINVRIHDVWVRTLHVTSYMGSRFEGIPGRRKREKKRRRNQKKSDRKSTIYKYFGIETMMRRIRSNNSRWWNNSAKRPRLGRSVDHRSSNVVLSILAVLIQFSAKVVAFFLLAKNY